MADHQLFGCLVAGRAEFTAEHFVCEDNTKWLLSVPAPVPKPCYITVWLKAEGLKAIQGTGKTVAIYANVKGSELWVYVGKIGESNPSEVLQLAWQGPAQPVEGLQLGLAVEPSDTVRQKVASRMVDGSKDQGSVSPEGRTVIGTLPETAVGWFIGKGGCNIKQFEVDCGCKINLDNVTREVYTDCIHKSQILFNAFLLKGGKPGGGKGFGGYGGFGGWGMEW